MFRSTLGVASFTAGVRPGRRAGGADLADERRAESGVVEGYQGILGVYCPW